MTDTVVRVIHDNVCDGDRILGIGLSGGMDSMALFALLMHAVDSGMLQQRICAIHINHNVRRSGAHRRDISLIERVAQRHAASMHVVSLPAGAVQARAHRHRCGVEAAARALRLEACAAALRKIGSHTLLYAHHQGDQQETILLRLLEGAGMRGLAGMSVRQRMRIDGYEFGIVRPLLAVPRATIHALCRMYGIRYHTDYTNRDRRYRRNALRHTIIPHIARTFPSCAHALNTLAAQNSEQRACIAQFAAALQWETIDNGWRIDADRFYAAHAALRVESIYQLALLERQTHRMPYRFVRYIVDREHHIRAGEVVAGHGVTIYVKEEYLYWILQLM